MREMCNTIHYKTIFTERSDQSLCPVDVASRQSTTNLTAGRFISKDERARWLAGSKLLLPPFVRVKEGKRDKARRKEGESGRKGKNVFLLNNSCQFWGGGGQPDLRYAA